MALLAAVVFAIWWWQRPSPLRVAYGQLVVGSTVVDTETVVAGLATDDTREPGSADLTLLEWQGFVAGKIRTVRVTSNEAAGSDSILGNSRFMQPPLGVRLERQGNGFTLLTGDAAVYGRIFSAGSHTLEVYYHNGRLAEKVYHRSPATPEWLMRVREFLP
jgi:hypothetical protein